MIRWLPFLLVMFGVSSPAFGQSWMQWPVDRTTSASAPLTQGFYGDYISYCGTRDACGTHNGYDFAIVAGTPLYPVAPGVVDDVHTVDSHTSAYGNAGKWVRIRHDSSTVANLGTTYYVSYLHMNDVYVAPGQYVDTTTMVGVSGTTGGVGAHLHMHLATARDYCSLPVDPGCPTSAWVEGSVIGGFYDAPNCQSYCAGIPSMWLSPARYGGEDYGGAAGDGGAVQAASEPGPASDPCQGVTYEGYCDGTTLNWCESGQLKSYDCGWAGLACDYQDANVGFNCVQAPAAPQQTATTCESLGYAGRCVGSVLEWCENGAVQTYDCAWAGMVCGYQNDSVGHNCLYSTVQRATIEPIDMKGEPKSDAPPDAIHADGAACSTLASHSPATGAASLLLAFIALALARRR